MEIDANRRSVKELFQGGDQLEVPPYQRPYAWTAQEVDQLWTDIIDAGAEGFFLGPLVIFKDRESQKRDLVDGQQRLTTLQVVLALIRDRYAEMHSPRQEDPDSLIYTAGYAQGDDRFRFKSGRANWPVLRDYVLRRPGEEERCRLDDRADRKKLPRHVWTRNKPLVEAASRLRHHIDSYLAINGATEAVLRTLDERIATKVDMVAIEVTGLSDAFLLFETLNDRGLRLTGADLLKSHLLRGYDKKYHDELKLEAASQEWDELVEQLGTTEMSRFLRHYLLGANKKVRKVDIYPLFQRETRSIGPEAMLADLRTSGTIYAQLLHPETADPEVRSTLSDIRDTGVVTQYVALLPALRWLDPKPFIGFARTSEVLAFRWAICGLNAQELESIYQSVSEVLTKSHGSEVQVAESILAEHLPSDDEFFARFGVQRMGTAYVARYMLRKLENALRPRSELSIKDSSDVHIEHIMPVAPTDYWRERVNQEAEYSDTVSRWGNLTLLHKTPNQEIQNGPWSLKRDHYESSEIVLTKSLSVLEDWNDGEIEFRQAWMGLLATRVWSLSALQGRALDLPSFSEAKADPEAIGLALAIRAFNDEIEDADVGQETA